MTSWQDGLVVGHEGQARWLVPMQLVLQGMARKDRDLSQATPKDVLTAAMRRVGLRAGDWDKPGIELWRFSTSAWVEDATRTRALPLVQGVVPVDSVDRGRMLASARAGGDFLLRIMRDDGSFKYTVDPWLGVEARSAYNIVRHAGTAAALFEVAGATGDDRYLRGALRAMAFMDGWYRPGDQEGLAYVLDKDGKGKLGAFGLALLALSRKLEAAPEAADRERALQLGRQIVAMQQPDGSFDSYLSIRGDEPDGSVSLYYPGEAMLGLARSPLLGIDEGFLAAAHRGADYLIASRAGKTKLPPDAWLMQALDVLYAPIRSRPTSSTRWRSRSRCWPTSTGEDAPPVYAGRFRRRADPLDAHHGAHRRDRRRLPPGIPGRRRARDRVPGRHPADRSPSAADAVRRRQQLLPGRSGSGRGGDARRPGRRRDPDRLRPAPHQRDARDRRACCAGPPTS